MAELEQALVAIQAYLSGEEADADGFAAHIAWLPEQGVAKVPVHVAATGPHVIAAAARHADGVDFTVGAEPERLRWAVSTAREAAGDRELSLGAYLNVAVDPDRAVARDLVRGSTAIFARFATEGAPADGLSQVTREGIEQVAADYDEAHHGRAKTAHAQALGDDFIDRFAVVGDAAEVTERLREIESLGIERAIVVPGSLDADPGAMEAADERFAAEVVGSL